MEIIGYGEDSLTLWALKKKLPDILMKIDDPTAAEAATVFFRPSFGRGVSGLGEFDAIIKTDHAVYLIESKWQFSPEYQKSQAHIKLSGAQIARHEIFEKILKLNSYPPQISQTFCSGSKSFSLPNADTLLSKNLTSFYEQLRDGKSPEVVNFVLFFIEDGKNPPPQLYTNLKSTLEAPPDSAKVIICNVPSSSKNNRPWGFIDLL